MLLRDFYKTKLRESILNYPTNSCEWNIHGWACNVIRTAVLPFFDFFSPYFLFAGENMEEKYETLKVQFLVMVMTNDEYCDA